MLISQIHELRRSTCDRFPLSASQDETDKLFNPLAITVDKKRHIFLSPIDKHRHRLSDIVYSFRYKSTHKYKILLMWQRARGNFDSNSKEEKVRKLSNFIKSFSKEDTRKRRKKIFSRTGDTLNFFMISVRYSERRLNKSYNRQKNYR